MSELYHVMNRGVDKRIIYQNTRDYIRFLYDLYEFNSTEYALPNRHRRGDRFSISELDKVGEPLVDIHCFVLMPNHYHLLLSPCVENGISLFMKKLNMGYAKYFNERNTRSGALFQGKYRSVRVVTDAHFMYLPFYIHLNPLDLTPHKWRTGNASDTTNALAYLEKYRWSSHRDFMGIGEQDFNFITNRQLYLDFFKGEAGYVNKFKTYLTTLSPNDLKNLSGVTLE